MGTRYCYASLFHHAEAERLHFTSHSVASFRYTFTLKGMLACCGGLMVVPAVVMRMRLPDKRAFSSVAAIAGWLRDYNPLKSLSLRRPKS